MLTEDLRTLLIAFLDFVGIRKKYLNTRCPNNSPKAKQNFSAKKLRSRLGSF
jgi:hypothetical protein